jgi:rubrerythrin
MTQQTLDNLQSAFAGESQANRKYTAFAKKADDEGHPQIAKLFRAAAHAETVHALNHFKALGGVKSTVENLKEAIAGETYEVDSMYPPMIAEAEAAGEKQATRTFKWAFEVEKTHAALYTKALEMLGQETGHEDFYVCPFCGHTHEGPFEGKCPVCGAPFEKFERIG